MSLPFYLVDCSREYRVAAKLFRFFKHSDMGQSNSTSVMMMSTYFTTTSVPSPRCPTLPSQARNKRVSQHLKRNKKPSIVLTPFPLPLMSRLGASNLWFSSWTPTTSAATAGACIGLFFLAILSRFLSAVKACAEVAWSASLHSQYHSSPAAAPPTPGITQDKSVESPSLSSSLPILPSSPSPPRTKPFTPPFHLAIDLPRSLLFGLQSFVAYLLMLAVMSYSAYFFISVLLGLMVGELWVGRFVAMGRAEGEGHHGSGDQ